MSDAGDGNGAQAADAELVALREKLALLQQIQTLQGQVVPNAQPRPTTAVPKNVKVPEGRYTMSLSEFKTYSRDCVDYKTLTGLTDAQIVLQMRLSMDSDLKLAVDTNYPDWRSFTVEHAIQTVGEIVNQISNRAVYRNTFHGMCQGESETIREFTTRLRSCAADCSFVCPFDDGHDLTDYHMIEQIRSKVYDVRLQQELFQRQSTISTLQAIVQYCEDYESAIRDKNALRSSTGGTVGAVLPNDDIDCVSPQEMIAALSLYRRTKKGNTNGHKGSGDVCSNCAETHPQGKCPARGMLCYKCGKANHKAKCCKSNPSKKDKSINAAVLIAAVANGRKATDSLARLVVLIGAGFVLHPQVFHSIPDTGAEVTVAGGGHLTALGIKVKHLVPPSNNLQHVAGGLINVIGCCYLSFTCNDRSIVEKVYFIANVRNIFVSLGALKKMGIIHKNFPQPPESNHTVQQVCTLTEVEAAHEHGNKPRAAGKGGYLQEAPPVAGGKTTSRTLESEHHNKPQAISKGILKGSRVPRTPPTAGGNVSSEVTIPYPPTEENIPLLRKWLVNEFKQDVFNEDRIPFPAMKGEDQHIHLIDSSAPAYAVHTPSNVPFHHEKPVKLLLDNWVAKTIVTPVNVGEAVDWCSRLVVCTKKDGRPRITVDFQELNKNIKRETHHTPRPFDVICGIPHHSYKTVLDAKDGYHQIKLDDESSKLTTFITTEGRFRYLRAPQGLKTSGDAYTRRFDEVLIEIKNKVKIVDDSLLHDHSVESSFHHTHRFLQVCRDNDVTLSEKKFNFCQKQLEFAGFKLGWDSYTASDDILSAVSSFPMPESPSISDIRAWFGLVNQLAPFFATCKVMQPFRELLQSKNKLVYWDSVLQEVFEQSKRKIIEKAVRGLKYFNIVDRLCLQSDWSRRGIGFVLLQQTCTCKSVIPGCCTGGWQLVYCNSRFLQGSEMNYVPLEGELLGVVWSMKKARMFLLGCPNFVVQTDHKPLVPILGDKALDSIDNPRVVRLKEKTLPYSFQVQHLEGTNMFAADTFSRYPVGQPDADDKDLADEADAASVLQISAIVRSSDVFAATEADIREASNSDEQYKLLLSTIQNHEFAPSRAMENDLLKEFHNVKDRLSIVDGLVTYTYETGSPRLVVPRNLRKRVIENLHAAHQGEESILSRARVSVYWPRITHDIKSSCATCKLCSENAPSQRKEPLIMTGPPEFPFEQVVADLFTENLAWYLAFACRLTGWLEIAFFPRSTKSHEIITIFRELFRRFGVPEEISLDGASNLKSSETLTFLESWGVYVHRLASAYYPQSNGRAEAAVRTAKRITKGNTGPKGSLDTDAVSKALMQYRNTPIKGANASPAQLMLGRSIRDSVPQPRSAYKVSAKWEKWLKEREIALCKSADTHTKETSGRSVHAELSVGSEVLIQNNDTKKWDRSGLIVEACPHRQYKIRVHGSGRITLRNRMHIRPLLTFKPTLPVKAQQRPFNLHPVVPAVDVGSNLHPVVPAVDVGSSPPRSESTPIVRFADTDVQTPSASSYQPSYSDISSQMSERSRSPMPARRRQEPDRYGDWGQ